MHILIATDADWVVTEITAALGGDDVSFVVCRDGRVVSDQVGERLPDLVICDLQIGSMGGMAVTMALRLDESAGMLEHVPVLMLLDRAADLHLARRSGAEGWLIKPLDALRLSRAADSLIGGGTHTEGLADDAEPVESMIPLAESELGEYDADAAEPAQSSKEDSVNAG